MSGPLSAMIAASRAMHEFDSACAREAAPLVEAEAQRTAKAGVTPDGKARKEKKSGGRALEHAGEHVSAKANGPVVIVTLEGVDVIHNFGDGHNPKRQIIPSQADDMPEGIAKAVEAGTDLAFARAMGGR